MPTVSSKLDWQRALVTLSGLAVFGVVVAALYWARSIFIPLALAVFLTFVMSPVVAWLERRGLGRLPAVLATVALGVVLAGVAGGLVAWQLAGLTNDLPNHTENIKRKLEAARQQVGGGDEQSDLGKMVDDLTRVFTPPKKDANPDVQKVEVVSQGAEWWTQVSDYASPVTEVFAQVGFGFVLAVFMLLKKEDLRNRLIRLTGGQRVTTATKAVDDASKRISRYLFMQLLLNAGVGVLITVAMFAIGGSARKYCLLWGFLAFVMRYIPYLGTWLGLIPPVIITAVTSEGDTLVAQWWQPVTIVVVYGLIEITCNNVFEPWLYGTSLGVSEVAQLVAAAFWSFLWGPIGLILSGPLTVCLLVLGKYVPRFDFFAVLLGDEPALSADVRLYQRLAARDQDEATVVAREELKKGTAEQVFDTVLIPALTYAKRDHDADELTREDLAGILQSVKEITDDLIDSRLTPPADAAPPPDAKVRMLAVPARDDADEAALNMLRGLLDPARWEVEVAPDERLTSEVVARAGEVKPAVIVIGSLPPGGLAHTRYLCKRISRQFPDARVVVGRWGETGDSDADRQQLADVGAAYVTTSLTDTVRHFAAWKGVLQSQQEQVADGAAGKSAADGRVGTPPAKSPSA